MTTSPSADRSGRPAPAARLDLRVAAILTSLCALWGLGQVAVKVGNSGLPPLLHATFRSAGAALLLTLWCRAQGIRLGGFRNRLLYSATIAGLFAAEFVFIYWGFVYTTASRGVLFLYAAPFVVALLAHFVLPEERLTPGRAAGLLCAFGGLALAFGDGLRLPTHREILGDLLEVVGAIFWGTTTIVIKAYRRPVSPHQTLFDQLAGSALILVVLSALTESWTVRATGPVVAAVLYQIVVVAFASYLTWFWLLTRYPAALMSAFTFWTPIVGLAAGWLILGDPVSPALLGAVILVALGIYLVNRG